MPLALPLLALAIRAQAKAPTPTSVQGCVFVSTDPAVARRGRAEFPTDGGLDRLAKRFPEPRFAVRPWGADYAIVIDRESGPLGAYHDRRVVLDSLQAKLGGDRVLRLGDLGPAENEAIGSVLQGRSFDPQTHEPINPTALGLYTRTNMIVSQGTTQRMVWSGDTDAPSIRMRNALREERRSALVAEHGDRPKPPPLPEQRYRNQIEFTAVGRGHDLEEAMEQVAPIVREMIQDAKRAQDEAAARLLEKIGLGGSARLTGELSRDAIPKDEWKGYADHFADGWRGMGFANEGEARAFLDGATSIRFTTSIGLQQTLDPGDPAHHVPGSGGIQLIYTLQGVYGG